MPRRSSMKPINLDEEEEEEEDAAFTAEEAQMRAAQLQKELEEQNKFDCLCDGVNSAISLVDSAFIGLLELKDELVMHGLPPSLLASVILTTGRMYRSITDLHTPIRELTRLVNVYSVPWEQKSEQLKKLHTDYESKQRQLNIAVRKLQLIDTQARRLEREKIINNWEKVFAKVSSAKTHGRRWKFMIEAFKKKVKEGALFSDIEVDDDDDDDSEESEDEEEPSEQDEAVAAKQRFMMSVITASPPQEEEEDMGSQPPGSELGSEADGIPSEVTESSGKSEDMSPDLHRKPKRHGVSFGPVDEVVKEVVVKPEMKDAEIWTDQPEYETTLNVRVFRPLEMKDDDNQDISCSLTLGDKTLKTGTLPIPTITDITFTTVQPEVLTTIGEKQDLLEETPKPRPKAGRRKSIGFAKRPVSPPAPSSMKSKPTKPSSILKKLKSPSDEESEDVEEKKSENPTVDKSSFKEVSFPLPEHMNDSIKVAILQGEKNTMISMAMLSLQTINIENLPIKYEKPTNESSKSEIEEGKKVSEEKDNDKKPEEKDMPEEVQTKPETTEELSEIDTAILSRDPVFVSLQGIKLGIGGHGHSEIGKLPMMFYLVKKEIPKYVNKECNTESIRELVKDVIGVDLDQISKDDLINILSREYNDVCTSAMSFASSSSHKSGFIAPEELEAIQEQHDKELQNIQAEYEMKLQQYYQTWNICSMFNTQEHRIDFLNCCHGLLSGFESYHTSDQAESLKELQFVQDTGVAIRGSRKPRPPVLPDWGAHLPKNVWVRMKMLTEEMIEKRHQLEGRVRKQIASNIEKKLASQYKLQRANNTIQGPLQDVSLPAVFMPSRTGNVYNPRAHLYFHPTGTSGDLRLSQPPSIFQLPPLPEKARLTVVNLFDLSKNFQQNSSTDWLTRIASAAQPKGSRATTAATRASRLATPNTPAPTANI
uniref:LOW QUALITY PROTEIN: uncharacterized protein LOC120331142 n=1 Tax=Styela clava TaxID=7725 RepID=UPI0019399053|nr:LOW QUALITY PROTEIN: uncharacterized protein LOC120331142 [Styela clava]